MHIDLAKYQEFVGAVTSDASENLEHMIARLNQLKTTSVESGEVNLSLLITAAIGLSAETGEFSEIPKKVIFQGKPLDADTVFHMKRELGDIMWYWINACRALALDPNQVIMENVQKLQSRYPGGTFDPYHSENRKIGDI
jgi:NTP pyrophosphatase (non-canonical NTP hydrolase)